ncbi:MAG: hypothetical protein H8E26_02375 [FCB group bacterium]|nr:hypothetical protein [FCB group bacterium]MBL7027378.1 hypothetical protein [Candidatus Neomarinimicrobiota bacterium]MBL7122671.1 hypothetical protein [Candidatus Neomarinimicrobiota bacterium]
MDKRSDWFSNKPRVVLWGSIGLLLLIPLVAMQFTDEVNWDFMDFIVAGALLTFAALAFELASKKLSNSKHQWVVGIVILAALIIVWIELAVGLF